jgi:anti-sigma regulatory factor (Ser/Thr protein kinase)
VPPAHPGGTLAFRALHGHSLDDQPLLQDSLTLQAAAAAVPCARQHARQMLEKWGLAGLSDCTELLVSELVTNAVKASRCLPGAHPVWLFLLSDSVQILVLVWDASAHLPARKDFGAEAENGRGLILVAAMSEQWGWFSAEDDDGKFVWAITKPCEETSPE